MATGRGLDFFGFLYVCMYALRKNLTLCRLAASVGHMTGPLEESYYAKNREKRLAYQKKWYRENAEHVVRQRELWQTLEPEAHAHSQKGQIDYNRNYYAENKARINLKRKETKAKQKLAREQRRLIASAEGAIG